MHVILDWVFSNKLEIGGTLFGLIYIWFSIRQNIYTWPAGILTALLYCGVFFEAKLYASMSLQGYYLIISVYGWYSWTKGGEKHDRLKVSRSSNVLWLTLILLNLVLLGSMHVILSRFTDSPTPLADAFITSLSIIATWMLARKKLEHWLIWIVGDLTSAVLYLYLGLYPTVFLFFVYAIMAVVGYNEWRKELELVASRTQTV